MQEMESDFRCRSQSKRSSSWRHHFDLTFKDSRWICGKHAPSNRQLKWIPKGQLKFYLPRNWRQKIVSFIWISNQFFSQLNDGIPGTRKINFILDKLENSYENLFLKYIDLLEFSERTPLEGLMKSGKVLESNYFMEHLADVLRLLTLWKFGGTYLDLDVIVKDPIESIGENFACLESSFTVANGLLNFDIAGDGIKILDECVK